MSPKERAVKIADLFQKWADPGNRTTWNIVANMEKHGLYEPGDTAFAIQALKNVMSKRSLLDWLDASGMQQHGIHRKKVLCLHAGNLPMVGFQDMLAVLLSGADYYGKASRKDPWLIPDFVGKLDEALPEQVISCTTDLEDFQDVQADAVIFAGSGDSVKPVKEALYGLNAIHENTTFLMRTAGFSVAWMPGGPEPEDVTSLMEAISRYQGAGCRSVKIVVSPHSLVDWVSRSGQDNGIDPSKTLSPSLKQRSAYNYAVGIPQMVQDGMLIEQATPGRDWDGIAYWIQGDEEKLREVLSIYKEEIQAVYTSSRFDRKSTADFEFEALENSQNPEISWRPDGIDTLEWLSRL